MGGSTTPWSGSATFRPASLGWQDQRGWLSHPMEWFGHPNITHFAFFFLQKKKKKKKTIINLKIIYIYIYILFVSGG
jgi:hypothetical protein